MRSRLSRTGNKFKFKMRKIDGSEFYGQILDIPDTSRVTNFLAAKRYLRTGPHTNVKAGDIIIAGSNNYIVGNHGEGFHLSVIYKHFKLFEIELALKWSSQTEVKNPITGILQKTNITMPELCYMSLQPHSLEDDPVIQIGQEQYICITNVKVKRGDILGENEYIVTKVTPQLGLYLIEIKEN